MHNFSKTDASNIAVKLLCYEYDEMNSFLTDWDVPLSLKIEIAKRRAIKEVVNNCQCNRCIDIAYEIHELNLFI